MTDPVLIAPPVELLTLPEVRSHLRVDHSAEDPLLEGYIAAAVAWMDGWHGILGRCILTQTWAIKAAVLADLYLPFPDPVSAVVTYLDTAGAVQTVAPADYRVRTINGQGWLTFRDGYATPPILPGRDDAVTVTAVYGQAQAPAPLKVAALMLVAHWYGSREGAGVDIPAPVNALVAPWRVGRI